MRPTLPIAGLLAASLALVPAAGAQEPFQVTVHATADGGPATIEPAGPPGLYNVTVELSTQRPPPGEVRVHLEPHVEHDPSDFQVEVEPDTLVFEPASDPEPDTRQRIEEEAAVAVAAERFAGAFRATAIRLEPQVEEDPLYEAHEAGTQVVATPGFRPGLEVQANASAIAVPAGDEGHARATVRNLANGETVVAPEPVRVPEGCSADPIDPRLGVGVLEEREAAFHVACSSDAGGGELTLAFRQRYAPDPSVPDAANRTVTWTVEVEDPGGVQAAGLGPAGSPAAGLGLAALGGLALAVRRRA